MTLEQALRGAVGPAHVLTDPDLRASYDSDWTGLVRGRSRLVVRPGTTAEVATCVQMCLTEGVPLVTQGGNTGLVGGSVPDDSGRAVVLSCRRLRRVDPVDVGASQVTLGAGVTLAAAQAHVAPVGLAVGVDLAARDSATIGGMVATNAGGIHVLRHGTMRRQVAGLEAVLGTGEVVSHLAGLEKDNTGYDLGGLLCGSEGTLGVITAVRLRLVAVAPHRVAALIAFSGIAPMVAGLGQLRSAVPGLEAAEYMVRSGLQLVMDRHGLADPFAIPHPAYLLVEAAGPDDPTDSLAAAVGDVPGVADVAVAADPATRARLWTYRELHTESLAAAGPPRKYDVALPPAGIAAFLTEVSELVARRGDGSLTCYHFGHLGDGNVHLNVVGGGLDDRALITSLDGAIYELVVRMAGSISAEHGIGRLKLPWLALSRSPAELVAFRAVKHALDPGGILNPGVLVPDA